MKGRLSRLEARMEALVEGSFARWFSGQVHPRDIAIQLARALEDSAAAGTPAVRYVVRLSGGDAQALLEAQPALAAKLANDLLALAREAHLLLERPPTVELVADHALKPRQVVVVVESAGLARSSTQTMTPVRPSDLPRPPKAFVIVDGQRTVALTETVITLGRRRDSQLVVDDPRVSRTHAQLRLKFGRYVLYDLGSTAGTFVNGQRVAEVVLRAGDVISLGGVPVIYGEEDPTNVDANKPPGTGSTHAGRPASATERDGTPPGPSDYSSGADAP
jgi:hypothetical protein